MENFIASLQSPHAAKLRHSADDVLTTLYAVAHAGDLLQCLHFGNALSPQSVFAFPTLMPTYDKDATDGHLIAGKMIVKRMIDNIVAANGCSNVQSDTGVIADLFLVNYGKDLSAADLLRFQAIALKNNPYKADMQHVSVRGVTFEFLEDWIGQYIEQRVECEETLRQSARAFVEKQDGSHSSEYAALLANATYQEGKISAFQARQKAIEISKKAHKAFLDSIRDKDLWDKEKSRFARSWYVLSHYSDFAESCMDAKELVDRMRQYDAEKAFCIFCTSLLEGQIKSDWVKKGGYAEDQRKAAENQAVSRYLAGIPDQSDIRKDTLTLNEFCHKTLSVHANQDEKKTFTMEVKARFMAFTEQDIRVFVDEFKRQKHEEIKFNSSLYDGKEGYWANADVTKLEKLIQQDEARFKKRTSNY